MTLGGGAHCTGIDCDHRDLAQVVELRAPDGGSRPARSTGSTPRPHRRTRARHVRTQRGPFRPDAA